MTEVDFRDPFVGHLPGYLAESERTAPGRPSEETYNRLLVERWQQLLNSPESKDEGLIQEFLERHPSLLPGSHTVDGDSGHSPHPMAVISQPKLPGLSDRHPDFMWIASHSSEVFPILIEIETPHKQWFYGDRAEIHSDLTHAQGQLAEWRGWFNRGYNRELFIDQYDLGAFMDGRKRSTTAMTWPSAAANTSWSSSISSRGTPTPTRGLSAVAYVCVPRGGFE